MLKLLLLVGALVAVYFIFFKKKSLTSPTKSDKGSEETMIPCDECGTYVQSGEALMREGKYYCSRECMEKSS